MLYKEVMFLKTEWKKYIMMVAVLLLALVYFIYTNAESTVRIFICFFVPGIITTLQIIQNSVTMEKKNHMFEKLLTMHELKYVLLSKAVVAFIVSTIVTIICSCNVCIFMICNNSFYVESQVILAELLVAICVNWTLAVCLVILYVRVEQIIIINAVVMFLTMLLSTIYFAISNAAVPLLASLFYSMVCLLLGTVFVLIINNMKNKTVLK